MKPVVIYTTNVCPFCTKAKMLLDNKGIEYQELKIDEYPELAEEAFKKSGGRRTVPQIFIGDRHIGGCDDLYALEKAGELNSILAA